MHEEIAKLFKYMKHFYEKWRDFLLKESISEYSIGGRVRLYHYSKTGDDSLHLDPEYFLSKRGQYSRNDYNVSDMPRVFFYTDLDHAENIVKQGASLFSTQVPAEQIYDLATDPLGLIQKSIPQQGMAPDVDRILRSLANRPRKSLYGAPPESILPADAPPYKGAYYKTGGMGVVIWFEKIEVRSFTLE